MRQTLLVAYTGCSSVSKETSFVVLVIKYHNSRQYSLCRSCCGSPVWQTWLYPRRSMLPFHGSPSRRCWEELFIEGLYFLAPFTFMRTHATEIWPIKCEQKSSTSILDLIHSTHFPTLYLPLSAGRIFMPHLTLEAPYSTRALARLHWAKLHPILFL